MTITKNHIGGLIFLCLSIAYGYYGQQIPLLPGDEFEAFHARSLPTTLAVLGTLLSIALLVTSRFDPKQKLRLEGYDFALVAKLLVLVMLFAVALEWVGFLVATIFFLIGGYWLLGVRSIKMLLVASIPFAIFLWFALSQLLDVYLAPGKLFSAVFGG
ncbi:MAG: tripartite tricarboxylate transporter TctB family protein [Halopseudomonas sp.]